MKNKSAILQMFFGKRGNCDSIPCGEEYCELLDERIEKENELEKKLQNSPELLNLYKEAIGKIDSFHITTAADYYKEGFCFGVLLGMEIARSGQDD